MKKRILVVDDEPDVNLALKEALEENGLKVDAFNDSLLALENFEAGSYDLLILDIRMPKMNGFELYRHIKEKNPSMRIAFITAFEINKEEFNKVMPSVNVTDFISKPLSVSSLITKLKSMLANYPESHATTL